MRYPGRAAAQGWLPVKAMHEKEDCHVEGTHPRKETAPEVGS